MNERGKSSPFRLQSYEFPKQTQTKIAKTFHFIKIHSNDTPTLHADSRQKLVYYLAKTETFSTKRHCFIHRRPIRPHFLLAPTLLPLYARLRALSEFSFFAFTLHRPPYLPHSFRVRGEGKSSESLHPMQRKKISSRKPNEPHEPTGELATSRAFTLVFTLNILYIKSMQGTNFVF